MATLTGNVTETQNWFPLSSVDLAAGFYTIDSENVEVGGRHFAQPARPWNSVANGRFVKRGVAGSTAASHLSGATLTRYYPEAPSGAGAAQNIRLLGPYTVNWEDDGLNGNGTPVGTVGDVPAGAIVVRAWVLGTQGFADEGQGPITGDFTIGVGTSDTSWVGVVSYDASAIGNSWAEGYAEPTPTAPSVVVIVNAPSQLVAWVDSLTLGGGNAEIYALIAEAS